MRLKFPQGSEETVKCLSQDIAIVADYIPDSEFNHLTMPFQAKFNGGNRKMTDKEMALYLKLGMGKGEGLENFVKPMQK